MKSIFQQVALPTIPVDLMATLKIFFEKGTLEQKTLFEQLYVDKWFDYNLPQMDLDAEAIMASYKVRFMASVIGNDAATVLQMASTSTREKSHVWVTSSLCLPKSCVSSLVL